MNDPIHFINIHGIIYTMCVKTEPIGTGQSILYKRLHYRLFQIHSADLHLRDLRIKTRSRNHKKPQSRTNISKKKVLIPDPHRGSKWGILHRESHISRRYALEQDILFETPYQNKPPHHYRKKDVAMLHTAHIQDENEIKDTFVQSTIILFDG